MRFNITILELPIDHRLSVASGLLLWLMVMTTPAALAQEDFSFNRDVRPILASKCFACHGPDEDQREMNLRLDQRDAAIDAGAIVPEDVEASEMIQRIYSDDPDLIMPPPHANATLTETERGVLKQWISAGAIYETHWAFVKPQRPDVPLAKQAPEAWQRHSIDRFVFAKLQQHQLRPAPRAAEPQLLRRVYLALTGLPPSLEQADAYFASDAPQKYEALVDQLLSSPRYGEHWAQAWLDLARYADTNGYEKDRERTIWPYRDWVIRALNEDLPYDQFSIDQLAGDMLENPTPDQRVATGFHRNTMLNEEGGVDPLEYRFYSVVDRVGTTGTVWLGMTIGCAQCHTHKFDPITHRDYYQLMAYLNNADEIDFTIPDPEIERRRNELTSELEATIAKLADQFPQAAATAKEAKPIESSGVKAPTGSDVPAPAAEDPVQLETAFQDWLKQLRPRVSRWQTIRPQSLQSNSPILEVLDDGSIFSTGDITKRDVFELTFDLSKIRSSVEGKIQAIRIEAIPDRRLPAGGPGRTFYEGRKGDFFLSEVSATVDASPLTFSRVTDDFGVTRGNQKSTSRVTDGNGSSGWRPLQQIGQRIQLVLVSSQPIEGDQLKLKLLFERHYAASLGRFRISVASNPNAEANRLTNEVEALVAHGDPEEWSPADKSQVLRAFLLSTPRLKAAQAAIDKKRKQLPRWVETMVVQERPAAHPRQTFRHHRGEYLSPKEALSPRLPELFVRSATNQPRNRLELAKWLVSDQNPLAARVAVNRAWRAFFGNGLVRTNGDYGVQSEPPSHPKLLDWLAVEFQKDWSLKRLHRTIVLSETFRQDSAVTPEALQRDPDNRWLARGPRFRMTGEMFRDLCLQACGILSETMYGRGVKPPQPPSVTQLAWGSPRWNPDSGTNRFRRSIYTFKKRTAGFAAFNVFDAPSGENCLARRSRSNTPLQALTLLNDEMYLEMTRALGKSMAESSGSVDQKIIEIYRRFLVQRPTPKQQSLLLAYFQRQMNRLDCGKLKAIDIAGDASNEAAAWTLLTRVVMNLSETVTRQ